MNETGTEWIEGNRLQMAFRLKYETLERLRVKRPVNRVSFIAELCRGKTILDIGCLDETALLKHDTKHWLHGRIGTVARRVVGIDSSSLIPPEGLRTGENATITRGDGVNPLEANFLDEEIDIIVAGEFIEHLESPINFLKNVRQRFPGREFVLSTPNGCSLANTILGLIFREAQHPDHLQVFTFKILFTLCARAEFQDWEIQPYRFYATEMLLQSRGAKRVFVRIVEAVVRGLECVFPLLSFGYIVRIKI